MTKANIWCLVLSSFLCITGIVQCLHWQHLGVFVPWHALILIPAILSIAAYYICVRKYQICSALVYILAFSIWGPFLCICT